MSRTDPNYHENYYRENKVKINEYSRNRRKEFPEKVRLEKQRSWRKTRENYTQGMLYSAKQRARNRDIEFNISAEDILLTDTCPILGIKLVKGEGRLTDNSPSLDRVNPELGYTKGNVRVISYRANRYKNNMTKDIVQNILNYMSGII